MQAASAEDRLKKALGEYAAQLIEPDTYIGIGTGSTATCFIYALAERIRAGLHIKGTVATSQRSAALAQSLNIPILSLNVAYPLDITIDGADEVDTSLNVIKGKGGALFREKVVAASARRFIIIADDRKLVTQLGEKEALPVEVLPFAQSFVEAQLHAMHLTTTIRTDGSGEPCKTDQSCILLDCYWEEGEYTPTELDARLHTIPGIIETGFFLNMVSIAYIAGENGIRCISRSS